MKKSAALLLCLAPLTLPAAERDACPVPGHAIQWIADYCLFKEETDDLIAAGPCIDGELARSGPDDCATKVHYKSELCRLHLSAGSREGTLEACVDDTGFSGTIVRNNGG